MSITRSRLPQYIENLPAAITQAQLGFFFEEGGCYGMALALYHELRALGHDCQILLMPEGRHAFVRIGDELCDHQGAMPMENMVKPLTHISPEHLISRAETDFGRPEVLADFDLAQEMIHEAKAIPHDQT